MCTCSLFNHLPPKVRLSRFSHFSTENIFASKDITRPAKRTEIIHNSAYVDVSKRYIDTTFSTYKDKAVPITFVIVESHGA